MKATKAPLEGVWVLEPSVFRDHRGIFFESFNQNAFREATGLQINFVQDNHSLSYYGVLRGMHFQFGAFAQAKLVRVISGRVLDVIADIRPGSPSYGQTFGIMLSAENRKQLYIPRGFAHGFVTLTEYAEFAYKCDNFYNPAFEGGLHYNDPTLAIDWQIPAERLIISEKDQKLPRLAEINYEFE